MRLARWMSWTVVVFPMIVPMVPLSAQTHSVSKTVSQVGNADCDAAPLWNETEKSSLTIPFNGSCVGGTQAGSATFNVPSIIAGTVSADESAVSLDSPLTPQFSFNTTFTPGVAITQPYSLTLKTSVRISTKDGFDDTKKCAAADVVKSGLNGAASINGTLQCNWSELPLDIGPSVHLYITFKVTAVDKFGFQDDFRVSESAIWFLDPAPQASDLTGTISRVYGNKTWWVPDVPVELLDPSGSVVLKTYARENPSNTAKSWYRLQPPAGFDYTKDYRLHIKLQSDPDPALAKLMVFATPSDRKPIEIYSKPFKLSKDVATTKNVNIDRASIDADFSSTAAAVNAEAGVEVYWNVWREIYIARTYIDDRPLTYNLPLEVYLNAPSTFYCPTAAPPTCPTPSSIVLQARDSLPGGDPTVLWHEFGHYMLSEINSGALLPPAFRPEDTKRNYAYHYGFANSYSTAALDDGFATFWAWVSSDILDFDHEPQLYYNNIIDGGTRATRNDGYYSESNSQLWEARREGGTPAKLPRGEEFGIAAMLWDLYDKSGEVENTTGATWAFGGTMHTAQDSITVPADQIVTIFRKRKPRTLLELYNALKAELPATLTSLSGNPRNSGLSQLDELFVMQGAFADANGNWAYDFGEVIGKASHSATWSGGIPDGSGGASPADIPARPWRENIPPLTDSFITLNIPGTSTITVSKVFGPGLEKLNSTRQFTVTSGPFYLEMPSPHYPEETILSMSGAAPARINNQVYWSTPTRDALAPHTFTPSTAPAPSITSLGASSAFTGASLTINGANFSTNYDNNIVRFGNDLGYVLDVTPTKITAITPPIPAGSAPVSVEVNGKVSNSVAFSIADSSQCRYFVDNSSTDFAGSGGMARLYVYTTSSCQWSIYSQSSWITVDRPGVHSGNLDVRINVEPNKGTTARSGTLLINTTTLAVTQTAGSARRRTVKR